MSHDYACGTNDTPLPQSPKPSHVRRVVTVDAYRVRHDPEWDAYAETGEEYLGELHIERYGNSDRWVVRAGDSPARLHRDAMAWRERNGSASLRLIGDNRSDAAPERREIRWMFHLASMNDEHTFTLAEAFYVCGAEAP